MANRKHRAHKGGGRGRKNGAANSSATSNTTSGKGRGDDEGDLVLLTTSSSLLEKVGLGAAPTDLGLPDLLVDGLSPAEQNAALKQMVETHLFVQKDGRRLSIVMIEPMVRFVSDLFYQRTQQAILWKPRGGRWQPGRGDPHLADDGLQAAQLLGHGGLR